MKPNLKKSKCKFLNKTVNQVIMKHLHKVKEDKPPLRNLIKTFNLPLKRLQITFHNLNKKSKQQKQT